MTNTLNIPPHERVKLLRKGEKSFVQKNVKTGIMIPVGDREKTNTFYCDSCKNQLIIN